MIEAIDLQYTYPLRDENGNVIGAKVALDNISFSIKKGEFVAILGHNGSGKSTLARTLNALLQPTQGKVIVDGLDTSVEENLFDIRSNVGMVFQNPDNQIVASIVEEDVAFGPENMGVEPSKIEELVTKALETVQMQQYRFNSPESMSGGQKQRIAIAGVLAMNPNSIVFDESTSMLDPKGQKDIINAALKLNRKNQVSIILITHSMEEASKADKIILMDKGKIKALGTPKEIFSNVEELEKLGLELPTPTQIAYNLEKKGYKIKRGILTKEELVDEIIKLR